MSGFHSFFSLGGIAGALIVAGIVSTQVPPIIASLCITLIATLVMIKAAPQLLPNGGAREPDRAFRMPSGIVLLIGASCFIACLAEGAALDWSAVFLTSRRGASPMVAGLGYAFFSATMTVGRLVGDRVVRSFGAEYIIFSGALVAACGLVVATLLPVAGSLAGFALLGAGLSNIVPLLFSAAGRQTTMPANVALPAIIGLGYAGMLTGPSGIGVLAQFRSLETAFFVVAALLFAMAISSIGLKHHV